MGKTNFYDNDFKKEAVRLALSKKQAFSKTANELGVAQSTLCKWVRNHKLARHGNLSDRSSLTPSEIALSKALKELAIVKEERDILKKAVGIFSVPENK